MNLPFLVNHLKSNRCKVVFIISLIIGSYLVPREVITGRYKFLAVIFILTFSFTVSCAARIIKERVSSAMLRGSSGLGVLAGILGLSALQVCGLGVPACGASVGVGIFSIIFPKYISNHLTEHGIWIVIASILIQIYSLYKMKCFNPSSKSY